MSEFATFVNDFGRDYAPGSFEWVQRETIFHKNLAAIKEQNEAYLAGESSWAAAVNHLADRTEDEMKAIKGYKKNPADSGNKLRGLTRKLTVGVDLPKSVDWRTKGVVSPVKNQAACGSCWAHSAVESIESAAAIQLKTGIMELSPQQLVDCVQNPDSCGGTGGCEGATAELGFNYSYHGLTLNSNYAYTGKDGSCHGASEPAAVYVGGFTKLPENDASALLHAVATVGPISISVAASKWGFYSHGVFDGGKGGCDYVVDHAVQLVGYGTDEKSGEDYWLVRNSWSDSWGEDGYIRVKRNDEEPCGNDTSPLDGNCGTGSCACPKVTRYCGVCAILADSSYPTDISLTAFNN